MKLTKSKLKEIIREELNEASWDDTDIREKVLSARNNLDDAMNYILASYGRKAEYRQLQKAFKLVDKWYKDWK